MFDRRTFIKLASAIPGVGLATAAATASAASEKQKVAYHVTEQAKVGFVITNIRNHINGMGGPENVEIVLVAHGPALKQFHVMEGNASAMDRLTKLMGKGVKFNACGVTMKALNYQMDDLIEGAVRVDQGGVVRLAQLQQDGYLYLRP